MRTAIEPGIVRRVSRLQVNGGRAGVDLRDREARDRPEALGRLAGLRDAGVAGDREEDERVLDREAVLVDEQPRRLLGHELRAPRRTRSAVACGSQRSASSVTGHVACFPLSRSKRMSTSPAISTPVKQISPSPIAACMSPTANMPPGCRTGKKMRAPAAVQVVVEVAAVAAGEPVRELLAVGRDADDADHRPAPGSETRSFIFTIAVLAPRRAASAATAPGRSAGRSRG